MPNHKKTKNLYYSYDINNAHIVSMNSEIFFNKKAFSQQYKKKVIQWLEKDLKNKDNYRDNFNKKIKSRDSLSF